MQSWKSKRLLTVNTPDKRLGKPTRTLRITGPDRRSPLLGAPQVSTNSAYVLKYDLLKRLLMGKLTVADLVLVMAMEG